MSTTQAPEAAAIPSPFNPDPATRDRFLDDFTSPDLSLRELAQQYRTTLTAVTDFILAQSTQALIDRMYQAAMLRIRATAAAHLPRAIDALHWTVVNSAAEAAREFPPTTPRAASLRERQRENTRRAANLLAKLTTLIPPPDAGPESEQVRVDLAESSAFAASVPAPVALPITPETSPQKRQPPVFQPADWSNQTVPMTIRPDDDARPAARPCPRAPSRPEPGSG